VPKVGTAAGTAAAGPSVVTGDEEMESDSDLDFIDSDYDLEDQDDDLFVENVDEDVIDQGAARGKKIGKGESTSARKLKKRMSTGDDVSSDEDDLYLPDSDGEDQVSKKFKSFRDADLENPVFKVGMIFDSVQMLRKAVTEYSLKHRVDISFTMNEKKRLRA